MTRENGTGWDEIDERNKYRRFQTFNSRYYSSGTDDYSYRNNKIYNRFGERISGERISGENIDIACANICKEDNTCKGYVYNEQNHCYIMNEIGRESGSSTQNKVYSYIKNPAQWVSGLEFEPVLELVNGWNLISVPHDSKIMTDNIIEHIYEYDSQSGSYIIINPENDDNNMVYKLYSNKGYWVKATI